MVVEGEHGHREQLELLFLDVGRELEERTAIEGAVSQGGAELGVLALEPLPGRAVEVAAAGEQGVQRRFLGVHVDVEHGHELIAQRAVRRACRSVSLAERPGDGEDLLVLG